MISDWLLGTDVPRDLRDAALQEAGILLAALRTGARVKLRQALRS